MSQKRYDLTDLDKIEITSNKLGDVYFKPRVLPILLILVGLLFILFKSISGYIICGLFVAFGLILIFIVKEKTVLSVYEDSVIVYDLDQKQGVKLENDEIAEWNVNLRDSNQVYIRLNNGLGLTRVSFRLTDCAKWMNQTMPEKNTANIRKAKGEDNIFKRMVIARNKSKAAKKKAKAEKTKGKK